MRGTPVPPTVENLLLPFGGVVKTTAELLQAGFESACMDWLDQRKGQLAEKTYCEYSKNIKILGKFFGTFRLPEIDGDLIRGYQNMRQGQCKPNPRGGAPGATAINHEVELLVYIRKCLNEPLYDYKLLQMPKGICGTALNDEQKARLLRIAMENKDWYCTYLFAAIASNTSCGPKETFTLHLRSCDMEIREITVEPEGAKNRTRVRHIPLNDEAFNAVVLALNRARELGATEPDHYLFPFWMTKARRFDPTRHQTSFRKAWLQLRIAAGLPKLRMYDLRHTVITKMLRDRKTALKVVQDTCGHISGEMIRAYYHGEVDDRRAALDRLLKKEKKRYPPQRVGRFGLQDDEEVQQESATNRQIEELLKQNAQLMQMLLKKSS